MNDLDDLLTKQVPKPKRNLSTNFTESVLQEMRQEKQSFWQTIASSLHIRRLSRASAAALLAVVFVSGSVAALNLWPKPSVTPTVTNMTPSGNRIVGYDAANCLYFASLDGRKPQFKSEKIYYEVHKDSSLTAAQIQEGIQALCEDNVSNNAISAIVKQLPHNLPGMQSTFAYTITDISKTSITVSLDPHYNPADLTLQPTMTYAKFAKNLLVYNQDSQARYSDLAVGDTVKMVVRDSSGKSSETPGNYNALNHPEKITILGIVKMPPLSGDPNLLPRTFATDIVRLEPCDNSPTGLCRAYEFSR